VYHLHGAHASPLFTTWIEVGVATQGVPLSARPNRHRDIVDHLEMRIYDLEELCADIQSLEAQLAEKLEGVSRVVK
jgi:hypothetical protein